MQAIITIYILFFMSINISGQNSNNIFLFWPQLIVRTNLDEKYSYEGVMQMRIDENLEKINLFALTNTIYYRPANTPVYLGLDYTFIMAETDTYYRQIHWIQPKLEYRPAYANINLMFRLMYAHLWAYNLTGSEFKAEDNRIRLLYHISLPLNKKFGLTINDEFFVLGRKSLFRENRFQCSLNLKADKKHTVALGYFYRWIGSTRQVPTSRYENALTMTFLYTIND